MLTSLLIDSLAVYIPFRLLRPLSSAHSATSSSPIPNRELLTDIPIQIYTTLLGASIYSVVLYSAYMTYLPVYLVTYFESIITIAATHTTQPTSLIPLTIPLGLAAKSFIFTPSAAALPSLSAAPDKKAAFDPVSSTLAQTFWYNVWGYSARTKVVIKRTAALALLVGGNTVLQTWGTMEGVEVMGALAYSAPWVAAAGITGAVFGVVGAV